MSETEYVVEGTNIVVVRVNDQKPIAGMRFYKRSNAICGMWLRDDEVREVPPKKKPKFEEDFHILRYGRLNSSKRGWFVKVSPNNWTWLGDGLSVPSTHFRWDSIVNNDNIHWPEGY